MPSMDLAKLDETLAYEAGRMMMDAILKPKDIASKTCHQDLVTESDKAIEELIKNKISEKYPHHHFIGEESHVKMVGNDLNADKETWIVDPIDGTMNFVHGFPSFCVSIGLAIGNEPMIGVIYNPSTKELFKAGKGLGATLNGVTIKLNNNNHTRLEEALVVTEYPSKLYADHTTEIVKRVIDVAHGVRMTGSAALNLCSVAAGRCDAYIQIYGLKCWDICAGIVIVREAGGHVTSPKTFNLYNGQVIATSTPQLAQDILDCIISD